MARMTGEVAEVLFDVMLAGGTLLQEGVQRTEAVSHVVDVCRRAAGVHLSSVKLP